MSKSSKPNSKKAEKDDSIKTINLKAIQKNIDKTAVDIVHTTARCAIYNGQVADENSSKPQLEWKKSGVEGSLYLYKYDRRGLSSSSNDDLQNIHAHRHATAGTSGYAFTILNKGNDQQLKQDLLEINCTYHAPYILYQNAQDFEIKGIWFSDMYTFNQTSQAFKKYTDVDSGITNGDELLSAKVPASVSQLQSSSTTSKQLERKKKMQTKKARDSQKNRSLSSISAEKETPVPVSSAAVSVAAPISPRKVNVANTASVSKQNNVFNALVSVMDAKPEKSSSKSISKSPSKPKKSKSPKKSKEVLGEVKIVRAKNVSGTKSVTMVDPAILGMSQPKPANESTPIRKPKTKPPTHNATQELLAKISPKKNLRLEATQNPPPPTRSLNITNDLLGHSIRPSKTPSIAPTANALHHKSRRSRSRSQSRAINLMRSKSERSGQNPPQSVTLLSRQTSDGSTQISQQLLSDLCLGEVAPSLRHVQLAVDSDSSETGSKSQSGSDSNSESSDSGSGSEDSDASSSDSEASSTSETSSKAPDPQINKEVLCEVIIDLLKSRKDNDLLDLIHRAYVKRIGQRQ